MFITSIYKLDNFNIKNLEDSQKTLMFHGCGMNSFSSLVLLFVIFIAEAIMEL